MPITLRTPLPQLLHETDTEVAHYQVWDTVYGGRQARVLYTGQRQTAQSGIAVDDRTELLFDYNQRFYELVDGLRPRRVLLIGGGVYTLPMAVCADFPELVVDVVEIDTGLDEIARQYFDFRPMPKLHITHDDGRHFLETTEQQYDLILIDAFVNAEIPASLREPAAATLLQQHLTRRGLAVYNLIATYRGPRSLQLQRQRQALHAVFPTVTIHPVGHGQSLWLPQNLLLIGQRARPHNLETILRYPSL